MYAKKLVSAYEIWTTTSNAWILLAYARHGWSGVYLDLLCHGHAVSPEITDHALSWMDLTPGSVDLTPLARTPVKLLIILLLFPLLMFKTGPVIILIHDRYQILLEYARMGLLAPLGYPYHTYAVIRPIPMVILFSFLFLLLYHLIQFGIHASQSLPNCRNVTLVTAIFVRCRNQSGPIPILTCYLYFLLNSSIYYERYLLIITVITFAPDSGPTEILYIMKNLCRRGRWPAVTTSTC